MTLPVPLRYGRNMPSLTLTNDPQDRATAILAKCGQLAGKGTYLGAARFLVSSPNSGAKTFVNSDPAGNAAAIAFDDQLVGWYVLREKTAETALITDSDAATQTITLATWISGLAAGEYIQFREDEPGIGLQGSGAGIQPSYLTHPAYVASAGFRQRILDRSDLLSVAQLIPNAFQSAWSDPAVLADGWELVFTDLLSPIDPTVAHPYGATFAQETDPVYTQFGGKSLYFEALTGPLTILTPPMPWTPVFLGQPMSLRARLLMTEWASHPSFLITMRLGVKFPSGRVTALYGTRSTTTVAQWFDDRKSNRSQPPSGTRDEKSFPKLGEGAWDDMVTHGIDITVPALQVNDRNVSQADIDAMGDALGLVVILELTGKGYLAGVTMTPTNEAVPKENVSAFGDANTAWSAVNQALSLTAKPQRSIALDVVDLKRLDSTLDEGTLDAGVTVQVDDGLDVVRDIDRITEVDADEIDIGRKRITIGNPKKRLADLLFRSSQRTASAVASIAKGVGSTPAPTPGSSMPSLSIDFTVIGDVPTVSFIVSPGVVKVWYATDPSSAPDLTATLAGTLLTSTPFGFVGSAMTPGDSLFVSAVGEDVNGVRTPLTTVEIIDPIPAAPSVGSATVIFTEGYDPFPGDPTTGSGSGFNLYSSKIGNNNYSEGATWSSTGGRLSGGCRIKANATWGSGQDAILLDIPGRSQLGVVLAIDMDAVTLSADLQLLRVKGANLGPTSVGIIAGSDKGDLMIVLTTSRQLKVVRPDTAGDVVLGTSAAVLAASGFEVLDIKLNVHNSAGTVDILRVTGAGAGTEILNVAATSTVKDNASRTNPIVALTLFQAVNNGDGIKWDDFTIYYPDTLAGGAQYLGDVHSGRRVPTGAGSYSDASGTGGFGASGTRWQNVDADTTDPYNVFAPTSLPRRETYALSAVDAAATEIIAALPWAMLSRSATGATDAGKLAVVSGATLAESSSITSLPNYPNTTAQQALNLNGGPRYSLSVDPATSAAWTLSGFGAIEAGWAYHVGTTDTRLSSCGVEYVFRT